MQGVFAYWDIGKEEKPLWDADKVYYVPCGPNFALRTAEQRGTRYNLQLGMAPGQKRRGEELTGARTDQDLRRERLLGSRRARGTLRPARYANHPLRVQLFRSSGETDAFLWGDPARAIWFGVPRWLWRQLIEGWLLFHILRRISPAEVWVRYLREYNTAWGAICYWRSRSRP